MPTPPVIEDLLAFAEKLADLSGAVLRSRFRQPVTVEHKEDGSPVTAIDRDIEARLRQEIARSHPDHGLMGEELDPHSTHSDYVWVIDPIDGTSGFITGRPLFGTLISLLHRGVPVLGVIDHPITRERWTGVQHGPALFNGRPCHTRTCASLGAAMLYASSPHMFPPQDKDAFDTLCRCVRRPQYGLDCYAYGLLSCGMIDIVAESTMKPCDFLALVPVVEAAGGHISDWAGEALGLKSDGRVLATGDETTHRRALDILAHVYTDRPHQMRHKEKP